MKFIIDNNLSPAISVNLKSLGFDAVHVKELKMQKSSDFEIFTFAFKENRIIVSADTDFGFILSQWDNNFPSVILFRNFSTNPSKQFQFLLKTIENFSDELEKGSLIILETERTRIKTLPYFPFDDIVPVAKGVKGADVIQRVKNQFGFECGTILWESKRHKRYDPKWVAKLKEDQRNEKANVSVLITQVLPDNISTFDLQDGVYIGSFNSSVGIASALRDQLIQIQILRQSEVGKNQKMESMYNYLTSHEFAQRISAILEAFELLQKQVNDERKVFEKQWAAREKMLKLVIKNTSGLHGDLKGLIGASLPDIEALQLPETVEVDSPENSVKEITETDDLPF